MSLNCSVIGKNHGKITKIHAGGEKKISEKILLTVRYLTGKIFFPVLEAEKIFFPVEVLVLYFIS